MSESINFFVSPVNGKPKWWVVTEDDSCSVSGSFDDFSGHLEDDDTRFAGYRLGYGETSPFWREGTRAESLVLVRELSFL